MHTQVLRLEWTKETLRKDPFVLGVDPLTRSAPVEALGKFIAKRFPELRIRSPY